jgi:hypothetical protein
LRLVQTNSPPFNTGQGGWKSDVTPGVSKLALIENPYIVKFLAKDLIAGDDDVPIDKGFWMAVCFIRVASKNNNFNKVALIFKALVVLNRGN